MQAPDFVILGAGGLAREALEAYWALGPNDARAGCVTRGASFIGFLSDPAPPTDLLERLGVEWLGPIARLAELPRTVNYVVAIGDSAVRRTIDEWARHLGFPAVSLIHPCASIARDAVVGAGTIVLPHATISTNCSLGRGVVLNPHSSVAHDCAVGDYVTMGPSAVACGRVTIDDGVLVGAGAVVNPDCTVGAFAVIGSSAAVIEDVRSTTVVAGVPAREIGAR